MTNWPENMFEAGIAARGLPDTHGHPDISEAGFEWCAKCGEWHLPDEHTWY